MDNNTIVQVIGWVVFLAASSLCVRMIARSRGSAARKFGWFFVSALGIFVLSGLVKGAIYLVVAPLALALYPARTDDSREHATSTEQEHSMSGFGEKVSGLLSGAAGIAYAGGFILIGLGDLYWLWMAIQLGSFWMFVLGLVPLFFIVTGPVGAWSLLFGIPEWVTNTWGS